LRDQREISRSTVALGRRALGAEPAELSPRETAEVSAAAAAQLKAAWTLERILSEIERASQRLGDDDEAAARRLSDSCEVARREAVAADMRRAAEQLKRNRIGLAVAAQNRLEAALREMLSVLSGRETTRPDDVRGPAENSTAETGDERRGEEGKQNGGESRPGVLPGAAASVRPEPVVPSERPDAESTRAAMHKLWGNLPQRARQQLLQAPREDYPPQYEPLIQEYFRLLSKEEPRP